ncbi:hypothetical protein [Photobacterium leiognathi]|uniref:hypothetical protein n=1 Tax=Photobacterium leiognathi TaxID=553611 RepID=UPI002980F1E1|nr:hypothetical protein [Photobacterium leiognathi]
MTMIAIALSPDFCVVAADRAVGHLTQSGRIIALKKQSTKIEYFTSEPMPFVATCAGLSDAVDLIPQIVQRNAPLTSRSDLGQLTTSVSQIVKRNVSKQRLSDAPTTTYIVALTDDNQLYFQAYHLNDDDIGAYDVIGRSLGIIPSGFDTEKAHEQIRNQYWRDQLTQAILPSGSRTKAQRLEAVLEVFQGAFGECASLNNLVSSNFDYCVINKSDRSITFNGTPPAFD